MAGEALQHASPLLVRIRGGTGVPIHEPVLQHAVDENGEFPRSGRDRDGFALPVPETPIWKATQATAAATSEASALMS